MAVSCQAPRIHQVRHLGLGYRVVTIHQPSRSQWSSPGYIDYLYYGDRRISDPFCDWSIAPSGEYAVYQSPVSGGLFLFRRSGGTVAQLVKQGSALATTFEWQEDAGVLKVGFVSGYQHEFPLR